MENLLENEAFCCGVAAGINLYQTKVVTAHRQKSPIKIGEELYYLETGKERLEKTLDEMCR